MQPKDFRFYWTSLWPHAPAPTGPLWDDVWKPLVERADKRQAVNFLRRYRACSDRGNFPPEPHEFAKTLDLIKRKKSSGQRAEPLYQCDYCDEQIRGYTSYSAHLDEVHPAEVEAAREASKSLLAEWKSNRRKGDHGDDES